MSKYMIATPGDVSQLAAQTISFWGLRDSKISRFRRWVHQIDMKQRAKSNKYRSFESNEPGTFYATMVQLMTRNPAQHRIPLTTDDQREREMKGQIERLLIATYRDIDFARSFRLDNDELQDAMAKFELSDGWICVEAIYNESNKGPILDFRTYDTLDVHGEWDGQGLCHVIIRNERTKRQIQTEYPQIDLSRQWYNEINNGRGGYADWQGTNVNVDVCYWRDTDAKGKNYIYYCVVVNGQWAIKPTEVKWTNRIPMICLPVNTLPFRSNSTWSVDVAESENFPAKTVSSTVDWTTNVGRGIFTMNEKLYEQFNELWASILDSIDEEGRGTWSKITEEGTDDELAIGRGRSAVNALKVGESIDRKGPEGRNENTVEMLQSLSGMLQRGGISWSLTGQIPNSNLSGFAITQLLSASLTTATPYLKGLKKAYQQLDQLIIDAYRFSRRKSMKIATMKEGTFIEEEVDLSILEDREFYFEITLEPGLPDDMAERINTASVARRSGLLDRYTLLDEIIKVEDPELIISRQDEDDVMNLPNVKLRRMAMEMLRAGNTDAAMACLMELQLYTQSKQVQSGQMQMELAQMQNVLGQGQADMSMQGQGGPGIGGGSPEANPTIAAGRPFGSEGGGFDPSTMPPEMGGISPAAARGFAEQFVSGLGRGS